MAEGLVKYSQITEMPLLIADRSIKSLKECCWYQVSCLTWRELAKDLAGWKKSRWTIFVRSTWCVAFEGHLLHRSLVWPFAANDFPLTILITPCRWLKEEMSREWIWTYSTFYSPKPTHSHVVPFEKPLSSCLRVWDGYSKKKKEKKKRKKKKKGDKWVNYILHSFLWLGI